MQQGGGAGHRPAYVVWAVGFSLLFTGLNLRGVRASARFNAVAHSRHGRCHRRVLCLCAALSRRTAAAPTSTCDLFRSSDLPDSALLTGTSLAVLTYIGFDGISTLAEEAHNPRRNILLATVLSCLCIGLLAAAEVYAAQLIWPPGRLSQHRDRLHRHRRPSRRAALFMTLLVTLTIANVGSGAGAHLGAARLFTAWVAAGPATALLRRRRSARPHSPQQRPSDRRRRLCRRHGAGGHGRLRAGAHLLNFGALLAFMGVNLSCFVHYALRSRAPLTESRRSSALRSVCCCG